MDAVAVQTSAKYMANRCSELLTHANLAGIYLVLDGTRCPLKAVTNEDREDRRRKNLEDARRFKRQGRPDKAQDKYKACIKIKNAFAKAVAEAVMRRFRNDSRVQCIHSPYEADAQLVKLCMSGLTQAIVTEDSDVLVYLAACHQSFPILYKLDRDRGSCDVIAMDWLLSPTTAPSNGAEGNPQKKTTALDSILSSLASRETRRSGFGARLFVQACVLAGCDYAPSQLNGVGLVTAFKLVRDNAHRPAADRFRQILSSLSKKARGKVDVEEYEEILAKSEAVFYYHPVLQVDNGLVLPLTEPLTVDPPETDDLPLVLDHRPSMQRFATDWSFLGDMASETTSTEHVPVAEIVVPRSKPSSSRRKRHANVDAGLNEVANITEVVNPYVKSKKRKRDTQRAPLSTVNGNSGGSPRREDAKKNPFARFAHDKKAAPVAKKNSGLGIYLNNRQDVRFVKRNFSGDAPKPSYGKTVEESKRTGITAPRQHSVARQADVPIDFDDTNFPSHESGPPHEGPDDQMLESFNTQVQRPVDHSTAFATTLSGSSQGPEARATDYIDVQENQPTVLVETEQQFVYDVDVCSKYFGSSRRVTLDQSPPKPSTSSDYDEFDVTNQCLPPSDEVLGRSTFEYASDPLSNPLEGKPDILSEDYIEEVPHAEIFPLKSTRPTPYQNDFSWVARNSQRSDPSYNDQIRETPRRQSQGFTFGSAKKNSANSIHAAFARQAQSVASCSDIESPASCRDETGRRWQFSNRHASKPNPKPGRITNYFRAVVPSPEDAIDGF